MSGNDMQRFLTVLMEWGIGFSVLLAGLFLLLGATLIWCPQLLANIFRFGAAILCFAGFVRVLVSLLIGVCKRK